jgi:CHASE3 domain sensor protein
VVEWLLLLCLDVGVRCMLRWRGCVQLLKSNVEDFQVSEHRLDTMGLVLRGLLNGETGTRGYQLTGDAVYLEPFNLSMSTVPEHMQELRAAARDEWQMKLLDRLNVVISQLNMQWHQTIADRSKPRVGFALALNDTYNLRGKATMDSARVIMDALMQDEMNIVHHQHMLSVEALHFLFAATIVSLSLVTLVVLVTLCLTSNSDAKLLQMHNDQLTQLLFRAEDATKLKSMFLANMSHGERGRRRGGARGCHGES